MKHFTRIFAALLLAGCSRKVPPSFTILEHTTASANKDGQERYVVRYDNAGRSVILITRCGYTQYGIGGAFNQGFCPFERMPAIGTAIIECTAQKQSQPCAFRAQASYLVVREGPGWSDDEINLYVESEKATK